MSEDADSKPFTANQLVQQQLATSLFKGWERLEHELKISAEILCSNGRSIVQNFGHPQMPAMTTQELIKYVKDHAALLETHKNNLALIKNQLELTVKFLKPKKQ